MRGGRLERYQSRRVNEIPEARRIEIDNGAREVDGRMVIEQPTARELDDGFSHRAFPGGWRSVKVEQ